MGFAEIRVEPQGRQRGGFGFRERVFWRQIAIPAEENVGIGDAGIGESVSGIFFDGLLKVFDGFVESVFGPLVPVMATLQVETVGLGIVRLVFGQALFFRASEFQPQCFPNFVGDFVLNGEDIAGLAIVLGAPQSRPGRDVDQLGANAQRSAALHDSAGEYGADVQFAADGLRINAAALEAEYGALGHHAQFGNGRENIDQTARDSVAEVFVLRVATGVFEWQEPRASR